MVSYYEKLGFLPAGLLNTLVRLGWSLDDKTETMSLDFMVEHFSLDRVVKGSAGFDPDKLMSYQEHWMSQRPVDEKVAKCQAILSQAAQESSDGPWSQFRGSDEQLELLRRLIITLGDRLKLFADILNYDEYFVTDDQLRYDQKAFKKRLQKPEDAARQLAAYRDHLAGLTAFDAKTIEQTTETWLAEQELKLGDIVHAVRIATTGKPAGPGLFECLELLNQPRCLNRIDQTLDKLAEDPPG